MNARIWTTGLLIALFAYAPLTSASVGPLTHLAADTDGTNQVLTIQAGHALDLGGVMSWDLVVAGVPIDPLKAEQNSFQSAVRMLENGNEIWYKDLVEYRDDWVTDAACYYNSRAGIHEGYVVIVGLLLRTTNCGWDVKAVGCDGVCIIPSTGFGEFDCTVKPSWQVDLPLVTLRNTVLKPMEAKCLVQML